MHHNDILSCLDLPCIITFLLQGGFASKIPFPDANFGGGPPVNLFGEPPRQLFRQTTCRPLRFRQEFEMTSYPSNILTIVIILQDMAAAAPLQVGLGSHLLIQR